MDRKVRKKILFITIPVLAIIIVSFIIMTPSKTARIREIPYPVNVKSPSVNSAVWTGTKIYLIGFNYFKNDDFHYFIVSYDPVAGKFENMTELPAGYYPTSVWTGKEILIIDPDIRDPSSGRFYNTFQIFSYDPMSNTLKRLNTTLPVHIYYDRIIGVYDGKYVYLSRRGGGNIWRLDIKDYSLVKLNVTHPLGLGPRSFVYANEKIYIIYKNNIAVFDPLHHIIEMLDVKLPVNNTDEISFINAIWAGKYIYITGVLKNNTEIFMFDPLKNEVYRTGIRLVSPVWPEFYATMVWDGKYIYIFGMVIGVYDGIIIYDYKYDEIKLNK